MATAKRLFSGTGVACRRNGRMLFQNLSFGVDPGEVLHLHGPNGAGKTSLLRVMAAALPAEGAILWNKENFLEKGEQAHARRIAFLPSDDRYLKTSETVAETLDFWAGLWGVKPRVRADAMARVQIEHLKDTPVRRLSAGQKRRLGLARVFMKRADLWLLDEPLNGLDDASQALFLKALEAHCAAGGMVVVASHQDFDMPGQVALRRLEVRG